MLPIEASKRVRSVLSRPAHRGKPFPNRRWALPSNAIDIVIQVAAPSRLLGAGGLEGRDCLLGTANRQEPSPYSGGSSRVLPVLAGHQRHERIDISFAVSQILQRPPGGGSVAVEAVLGWAVR